MNSCSRGDPLHSLGLTGQTERPRLRARHAGRQQGQREALPSAFISPHCGCHSPSGPLNPPSSLPLLPFSHPRSNPPPPPGVHLPSPLAKAQPGQPLLQRASLDCREDQAISRGSHRPWAPHLSLQGPPPPGPLIVCTLPAGEGLGGRDGTVCLSRHLWSNLVRAWASKACP